jgi:galactofuranosylgalactofuranosylrhamnosyl-N-acetylglucosaminyl-diphospho-decaprenol beta-1,5/1,6-galactofuranosyltransferase
VSLPGVAAWQAPWTDKNDAQDWQSYYHLRNRIVSALLHSQVPHGGTLIPELLERQLQNLLSMQYSTAALKLMAIEDVLSGPEHLHRDIGTKLKQVREFRTQFIDARDEADLDVFPAPRRRAPDALKDSATPTNKFNLLQKAVTGTARQFKPMQKMYDQRPQMALPYQDAAWFVMVKLDSVLVSTADGTSAAWYKRNPRLFRSLALRSVILHQRLRRRWPRLAAEYRAAAADITSPDRWRETFAASLDDPGGTP